MYKFKVDDNVKINYDDDGYFTIIDRFKEKRINWYLINREKGFLSNMNIVSESILRKVDE